MFSVNPAVAGLHGPRMIRCHVARRWTEPLMFVDSASARSRPSCSGEYAPSPSRTRTLARCRRSFLERLSIGPGTLADVERAIGLHPGPGRFVPPPQARAAKLPRGACQSASRNVNDVVEDGRQVLVQARRRHQGDDPAHRVEAHPAELAVPVDAASAAIVSASAHRTWMVEPSGPVCIVPGSFMENSPQQRDAYYQPAPAGGWAVHEWRHPPHGAGHTPEFGPWNGPTAFVANQARRPPHRVRGAARQVMPVIPPPL